MASTNSTTHYELSQYIGTDKPTYLVDYNQDMSKIDAGIYGAKSKADNNETSIGTLSSLQTTEKSNLVGAVNEVNTNSTNNATHIGTLSNLTTTEKSNLVGAVNEVKTEADGNKNDIGLLVNLNTTDKSNLVSAVNEVKTEADGNKTDIASIVQFLNMNTFNYYNGGNMTSSNGTINVASNITIATNDDKSLAKIYGSIFFTPATSGQVKISLPNTGLTPTSDINIINAGVQFYANSVIGIELAIKTNGTIEFTMYASGTSADQRANYLPCLYFVKDFGDAPNQNA